MHLISSDENYLASTCKTFLHEYRILKTEFNFRHPLADHLQCLEVKMLKKVRRKRRRTTPVMKRKLSEIKSRSLLNPTTKRRRSQVKAESRLTTKTVWKVANHPTIRLSVFESERLLWQKFLYALLSSSSFAMESGLCQTLLKWCRPIWQWVNLVYLYYVCFS